VLLLPQALVTAVGTPVAGRIYDRVGPRWPAAVGLSIKAWATYEAQISLSSRRNQDRDSAGVSA